MHKSCEHTFAQYREAKKSQADTLCLESEKLKNDGEILFSDDELMYKFTNKVTALLKELKEKNRK
jgi:hypothetical protein